MTLSHEQRKKVVILVTQAIATATVAAVTAMVLAASQIQYDSPKRHSGGIEVARKTLRLILYGPNIRFEDLFHMNKQTFRRLMRWLRVHAGLEDSRQLPAEALVLMTIHILAQGANQRTTARLFKVSQTTVSRGVQKVLGKLVRLHTNFVRTPPADFLDPSIELNDSTAAFNGCIGVIGGTQIPAFVLKDDQYLWLNSENQATQNVLVAVNFAGEFVYVLAGSEGSNDDEKVLGHALERAFAIPEGRYYLGNSDFSPRQGIIGPFQITEDHLDEEEVSERPPASREELYNDRHSSHRKVFENVIARSKEQWAVLRNGAPEYSVGDQVRIVYAAIGLYNFIIKTEKSERTLQAEEEEALQEAKVRAESVVQARSSLETRDLVADSLWADYLEKQQL